MNEPVRILLDPDIGEWYWVRVAPRDGPDARLINRLVESLVFETEAGEWVGAVPAFSPFRLQATAKRDLKEMLEQAKRSGP